MKRFIVAILALTIVLSLTAGAFADGTQTYTLYVDRNGKILKDADGNRVHGRVEEKTVAEFYRLMKGVPVNFDKFDNMVFDVTVDENGHVSLGRQVVMSDDGSTFVSENASVIIFENAGGFHFSGEGESEIAVTNCEGTEISRSAAASDASQKKIICSRCGEDESDRLHIMSCGHFSCQEGTAGHGDAECGAAGHYACDGNNHSICPNCLKPMCSGKHGDGVCKHVHSWVNTGCKFNPDYSKIAYSYYCTYCGASYYSDPIDNPLYKKTSEEPKPE